MRAVRSTREQMSIEKLIEELATSNGEILDSLRATHGDKVVMMTDHLVLMGGLIGVMAAFMPREVVDAVRASLINDISAGFARGIGIEVDQLDVAMKMSLSIIRRNTQASITITKEINGNG